MTVSPSYMIQNRHLIANYHYRVIIPTGPIPLNWYYNLVGFHWKSFKAKAGYAQGLSSLPDLADASA